MIKKFSLLITVILTMSACSSSEGGEQVITDSFDRGAMLVNIADNIIIPAYEDFNAKMNSLKSAGDSFVANPNQTNLDSFRSSWLTAYKTWQYVEMFNIGKAEELQYSFYMNIYPLTVSDVEENIANGSYDLN
ncbi:imelysin family protein, partial [Polaribacter sp.]|uniref:imelysin family protein n=1 Tax=Polaribacter sp. TaxID=1920175 RepID=UPI0035C81572